MAGAQPQKKPNALNAFAPIPDKSVKPEQIKMSTSVKEKTRIVPVPAWQNPVPTPKTVETGKENIKITVKSDIEFAEVILNSREEN